MATINSYTREVLNTAYHRLRVTYFDGLCLRSKLIFKLLLFFRWFNVPRIASHRKCPSSFCVWCTDKMSKMNYFSWIISYNNHFVIFGVSRFFYSFFRCALYSDFIKMFFHAVCIDSHKAQSNIWSTFSFAFHLFISLSLTLSLYLYLCCTLVWMFSKCEITIESKRFDNCVHAFLSGDSFRVFGKAWQKVFLY